jgi:ParB family chromosome partitioning protein
VPVIVRSFSSEREKLAVQIVENLQREDLNPIEVAKGYQRLKEEFEATDDEVAKTVGKSRAAVTNFIRLLRLDQRVQQMVIDEKLSMGHVRTLLAIEDGDKQYDVAQDAFDKNLSVRELEKEVKKLTAPKKASKKKVDLTQYQVHFDKYADLLAQRLGVKVVVDLKEKNQGKLVIDFYSTDDFDKLYERLSNEQQDT